MSDTDESKEPNGVVCLSCGFSNPEGYSRCSNCGSPLDDFAASAPWEMGTSKGSTYSSADSASSKPVVLWGIWLYFGLSGFVAVLLVFEFLYEVLIKGVSTTSSEIVATIGILAYGLLSGYVLWVVTKGYRSKRRAADSTE